MKERKKGWEKNKKEIEQKKIMLFFVHEIEVKPIVVVVTAPSSWICLKMEQECYLGGLPLVR